MYRLDHVRRVRRVQIRYDGKRGGLRKTLTPEKMEYSSKDDKFRFTGYSEGGTFYTVNVARVKTVELMERAMLHISDLEKETIRLGGGITGSRLHTVRRMRRRS